MPPSTTLATSLDAFGNPLIGSASSQQVHQLQANRAGIDDTRQLMMRHLQGKIPTGVTPVTNEPDRPGNTAYEGAGWGWHRTCHSCSLWDLQGDPICFGMQDPKVQQLMAAISKM